MIPPILPLRVLAGLCVLAACRTASAAEEQSVRQLVPASDFTFASQGNFTGRKDRRGLLLIEHPLATSSAGDRGFFRAEVVLSPDATPPHLLYFYATDNNIPAKSDKGYMMVDQRVGHRFQQIRINGEVAWSEDTNQEDNAKWKVVDITKHVPESKRFVLEAGLFEEVDGSKVLPGDIVQSPPKKAFKPKQEWNQTESYWGDFTIQSGAAASQPPPPPRWNPDLSSPASLPHTKEQWQADALDVENGELVHSGWAWPAISGIPFPQGKFAGETRLTATLGGVSHPIRPLSHWPDGSIKWGLVQLGLVPGFAGAVKVSESAAEPAVAGAVHIDTSRPGTIGIRNDLIRLEASPEKGNAGLVLFSGSAPVLNGMQFYFESASDSFSVNWESPEVVEAFPERATVELRGDLVSASGFRYGRCRVRATVFAGLSSVRLLSSVYNETAKDPFQASAYGWKLSVPGTAPGESGDGWFTAGAKPAFLTGAIRYFRQLGPNGITVEPGAVTLQLFRPGDKETPFYQTHPGEAKTHEIWLAVTPDPVSPAQAKRFSMLVDRPPGLAVASLIRSSAVWGPMAKIDPEEDAELYRSLIASGVESYYADVKTGLRAFGNYPGFSSSFYWNSLHSMYALYAMTGERKWLDRAERSVRHLMDLLVCHWSPEKTSLGGMYSYYSTKTADGNRAFEPDFSNADFSIRSQNPHAAFDHWQLTGDADGKRIAIGIADFLLANPEMRQHAASGSARHQGWVLIALSRAYEETRDPRYRDYARTMMDTARTFIDPRRGAYLQIHSSVSHPGIVPFMAGILATGLRNFHEASGDPEALELLALVVTSSQEETLDRTWSGQNPGLSYHYSPNPHHRYEHVPGLNLGLVGGNAYLAALTGDKNCADAAREGWKGFLAGTHKSPNMEIYNLPDTLYWLKSLPGKE